MSDAREPIPTVDALVETADRDLENGAVDRALDLYQRAVEKARDDGDQVLYGSLLLQLGLAQKRARGANTALPTVSEAARVLKAAGAPLEHAQALDNLGFVERDLGDLEAARAHHEAALAVLERAGQPEGTARALVNLGIALKDLGRLTEARARLEAALAVAAAHPGLDRQRAHALAGLGLVSELLNETEDARRSYEHALAAYRSVGDHENEALMLHNIGRVLDNRGEHRAAIGYFEQSLAINRKHGAVTGIADDLGALGSAHAQLGAAAKAQRLYRQALRLQLGMGYRRSAVWTLSDLAIQARDQGRLGAAGRYLDRALRLAEEMGDPRELYEVRLHRGDLHLKAGRPGRAVEEYEAAAAAAAMLRRGLLLEDEALRFFDEPRLEIYDRLVRLNAYLGDLHRSYFWVQAAKSQEFLRRLATSRLPSPPGLPEQVVERERSLLEELRRSVAELRVSERVKPAAVHSYEAAQQGLQEVWAAIERFDPELAALRTGAPGSWEQVRAATLPDAGKEEGMPAPRIILVEFFTAEDVTLVFGVTATSDQPDMVSVPVDLADLRSFVGKHFGHDAADSRPDRSQQTGLDTMSREEWQERMGPLLEPIGRWSQPGDYLYLAPHDVLHYLPLHAVEIQGVPLIERNPVIYTPSASVLRYCQAKRTGRRGSALVLADSVADDSLIFAREQATGVAELFETAEVRVGKDATLDRLLAALQATGEGPDVLHFAVHGRFDAAEPLRSGIRLADQLLTADQILELSLQADLVTLSACESGVNDRRPGDELIGLTRTLIYAGTPSVLVSLWNVDELSTSMLMHHFYEELLKRGATKAQALQRAQLHIRDATARQALDYAGEARRRLAADPVALRYLDLTEAELCLVARDYPRALELYSALLARQDLDAESAWKARAGKAKASAGAMTGAPSDYTRRVYEDLYNWAPFVLVGDWL